jgi:hypothetical protein
MSATTKRAASESVLSLPSHDLLSWEEAAAYLGPSFTPRWVKRQVYDFKKIRPARLNGRTVVPRAELDRLVREGMAQDGR